MPSSLQQLKERANKIAEESSNAPKEQGGLQALKARANAIAGFSADKSSAKPDIPRMGSGPVFNQSGKITTPKHKEWTEFQKQAMQLPELIKYRTLSDGIPDSDERAAIWAIGLGTVMTPDDQQRASNLKELGFESETKDGTTVVTAPDGEQFVVNRPGMSMTDMYRAASDIAMFSPAARATAAGWVPGRVLLRNVWSVLKRGTTTSAATSAARETAGYLGSGGRDKFSPEEVMMDTAIGPLEAVGGGSAKKPIKAGVKSIGNRFKREAVETADNLKSYVAGSSDDISRQAKDQYYALTNKVDLTGMNPSELLDAKKRMQTERPGRPLMTQGDEHFSGQAQRAMDTHPIRFDRGQQEINKQMGSAKASLQKTLNVLVGDNSTAKSVASGSDVAEDNLIGQVSALSRSKEAAETLVNNEATWKSAWGNAFYDGVFDSITKPVDMRAAKSNIEDIIKKEVGDSTIADRLIKELRPLNEKTEGKHIQNVIRVLRDLKAANSAKDSSVAGLSTGLVKKMETALVEALDVVSKKRYTAADKAFSEVAGELDALRKSMIGKFAEADDAGVSTILKQVVNPDDPMQKALSKRFMEALKSANPSAANDLYNGWFGAILEEIPSNAKPSQISKALFGNSNVDQSSLVVLGNIVKTKQEVRRIRELKDILDIAANFEGSTMEGAIKRAQQGTMEPDYNNWLYIRQAPATAATRKVKQDTANAWINAALDPKWSSRWDELMSDKRVLHDLKRRSRKTLSSKGVEFLGKWDRFLLDVEGSLQAGSPVGSAVQAASNATPIEPEGEEQ